MRILLDGGKREPNIIKNDVRDIINEPRRQHSRKPESFYNMAETLTIGRKLDYFSREPREGWEVYGAETAKFELGG